MNDDPNSIFDLNFSIKITDEDLKADLESYKSNMNTKNLKEIEEFLENYKNLKRKYQE